MIAVGPALALLGALFGRALGTRLGFAPGVVLIGVVAIAVWVAIGMWRTGASGFAAALVWTLSAGINVHVGHSLALLASGEHVVGAHVADEAAWRDHERVTFGDGGLRGDLGATAGHRVNTDGHRSYRYDTCTATPIAPAGWTSAAPVRTWSLDEEVPPRPWQEQVFHPTTPEGDCATAIDRAIARHHLANAPDAIYLQRVDTLVDPYWLRAQGLAAMIATGGVWLIVCAWLALRDAWESRRR